MAKWDYTKDIDYDSIDTTKVKENRFLFYLLTIASFVEITSETYAKNLSEYYSDNLEAVSWINESWQKEELQHGKALRAYILYVWPEFLWQKTYERFLELYLPLCNTDSFQATRALEMLARMIVETGTSTMYRAFESYAKSCDEPVLAALSHYIYKDEVNHYSYFDHYFKHYNQKENLGRTVILKVIAKRLKEASSEDIEMGYQSIYELEHKGRFEFSSYELFKKELKDLAKKHYPYNMAIKMMVQPLNLNKAVEMTMIPVIRSAMKVLGI
ncbi:MAG: ferritin-like domain-containing protein [Thiovulaceae bacterium]|nr:ferritin-like domain-containing protein [Sulfurimonadaceae bacterium]